MFEQSKKLFKQALELDPNYSQAYAGLSWAYIYDYFNRWSDNPDNSLRVARQHAEQAIEKDFNEPFARVLPATALMERDFLRAKSEADIALSLNPNYALAYNTLGSIHTYSGEPLEAITAIERAMRLDPAWNAAMSPLPRVQRICSLANTKQHPSCSGTGFVLCRDGFHARCARFRARSSWRGRRGRSKQLDVLIRA